MNETTTIQTAWFIRLKELADQVEKNQGQKREMAITMLLGYLSSIDYLLTK